MKISFVRTQGQPDRVYVIRTDGSEVSWSFPTFGSYVPHDLVHLVMETAFGLPHGFWGRVDAGIDVARINAEANRVGGPNKYAKFGVDQTDLYLAEVLAAMAWGSSQISDEDLAVRIGEVCMKQGLKLKEPISVARIHAVRTTLDALCGRWIELVPKGALNLAYDPANLAKTFESLKQ